MTAQVDGIAPTGLLVQVDGHTVPIDKCGWYFRQPCGCYSGVTLANHGTHLLATAAQAWADYQPNRISRARDQAAGETCELHLTSRVTELMALTCPHTPKWGREETPTPDGYLWAASDGWKSRPRYKHLVAEPTEARDRRFPRRLYSFEHGAVAALCKRSTSRDWVDDDYLLYDLPECSACAKAAKVGVL